MNISNGGDGVGNEKRKAECKCVCMVFFFISIISKNMRKCNVLFENFLRVQYNQYGSMKMKNIIKIIACFLFLEKVLHNFIDHRYYAL